MTTTAEAAEQFRDAWAHLRLTVSYALMPWLNRRRWDRRERQSAWHDAMITNRNTNGRRYGETGYGRTFG